MPWLDATHGNLKTQTDFKKKSPSLYISKTEGRQGTRQLQQSLLFRQEQGESHSSHGRTTTLKTHRADACEAHYPRDRGSFLMGSASGPASISQVHCSSRLWFHCCVLSCSKAFHNIWERHWRKGSPCWLSYILRLPLIPRNLGARGCSTLSIRVSFLGGFSGDSRR